MKEQNDTVRGDNRPLPDKGTGTGVTDTYGSDISRDSTNRIRGMTSDTQSDPVKYPGNGVDHG